MKKAFQEQFILRELIQSLRQGWFFGLFSFGTTEAGCLPMLSEMSLQLAVFWYPVFLALWWVSTWAGTAGPGAPRFHMAGRHDRSIPTFSCSAGIPAFLVLFTKSQNIILFVWCCGCCAQKRFFLIYRSACLQYVFS